MTSHELYRRYGPVVQIEGAEECVIGIVYDTCYRLVYSMDAIIQHYMMQGLEYEEAVAYIDSHLIASYLGPRSPLLLDACEVDVD